MKRLSLLIACLPLLCGGHVYAQELPRLQVEGNHFIKPDGIPVTLRGVSLCSLEWHKPLEQIDAVSGSPDKWNVNVVRMPVQVQEWKRVGPMSYLKDYLDPAVKLCTKNGIYCIIDWHDVSDWNKPEAIENLESFWKLVAPRYAINKNILYEVFNEPVGPTGRTKENWLAWRKQAQGWVDDIRKVAPKTILLIGSPHWSQMTSFAADDPFEGDGLAYTAHVYPNWKPDQWADLFGKAAEKVPVFVTEWGWSVDEKAFWVIKGSRETFGKPFKAYLDARPHINWTAWSYDPLCGPAMLGSDKDMGNFVKGWLAHNNP